MKTAKPNRSVQLRRRVFDSSLRPATAATATPATAQASQAADASAASASATSTASASATSTAAASSAAATTGVSAGSATEFLFGEFPFEEVVFKFVVVIPSTVRHVVPPG